MGGSDIESALCTVCEIGLGVVFEQGAYLFRCFIPTRSQKNQLLLMNLDLDIVHGKTGYYFMIPHL